MTDPSFTDKVLTEFLAKAHAAQDAIVNQGLLSRPQIKLAKSIAGLTVEYFREHLEEHDLEIVSIRSGDTR